MNWHLVRIRYQQKRKLVLTIALRQHAPLMIPQRGLPTGYQLQLSWNQALKQLTTSPYQKRAAPIPAAASEIPITELTLNVTDRNLLLLLSQLCRTIHVTCMLDLVSKLAMLLPRNEFTACANKVFLHLADLQGETCNPVNYVSLSLEAMKTLSVTFKSSLICKFVYFATKRPGSEVPLMVINRIYTLCISINLLPFYH